MVRVARLRAVILMSLCLGLVTASSACRSGDSERDQRRYDVARDTFSASLRSSSAALASTVAASYLKRRAAGEEAPALDITRQLRGHYEEFNQTYCQDMKAIGKTISAGPESLKPQRLDESWVLARDLVFDAMASALLQGALAAPPEQRDQLLAALAIETTRARDGTEFSGMAALQEEGLLDPNGNFNIPQHGTAEYSRYKKWAYTEAKGFASRVDTLLAPTEDKMAECLPPR